MNSTETLLDVHERAQRSLAALLVHCRGLTAEELHRELPGFGYGTIQLQIHHLIGAQRYWVGVLQGRIDADEDAPDFPSIASLEAFREQIAAATEAYLRGAAAGDLEMARLVMTWGHREQMLVPARVIMRVLTHIYHHLGQIAAMCRLVGKPCKGLDYPLN